MTLKVIVSQQQQQKIYSDYLGTTDIYPVKQKCQQEKPQPESLLLDITIPVTTPTSNSDNAEQKETKTQTTRCLTEPCR